MKQVSIELVHSEGDSTWNLNILTTEGARYITVVITDVEAKALEKEGIPVYR